MIHLLRADQKRGPGFLCCGYNAIFRKCQALNMPCIKCTGRRWPEGIDHMCVRIDEMKFRRFFERAVLCPCSLIKLNIMESNILDGLAFITEKIGASGTVVVTTESCEIDFTQVQKQNHSYDSTSPSCHTYVFYALTIKFFLNYTLL